MAKRYTPIKEEFFVAVENPTDLRHSLLDNTRKVLQSKKVFHELKIIRQHKIKEKKELRKQIKDITRALSKLRQTIPSITLPKEHLPMKKQPKKAAKKAAPKPQAKKSEMDSIEDSLAAIEKKIASLK